MVRADVGMARQTAETAQFLQAVRRQLAASDHCGIEAGRIVPFGREEDIGSLAGRPVAAAHFVQKQPGDDIERAEARSDVARARISDHRQCVEPAQIGEQRRARKIVGIELSNPVELRHRDEHQWGCHAGDGTRGERTRGESISASRSRAASSSSSGTVVSHSASSTQPKA